MIDKVIFWIAVVTTVCFIGFYKSLRDKRTFSFALILSIIFVLVGIWGVVNNKYLIEGDSAYFFLFWLPSFVLLFGILRNYLLKKNGIEPIIGWMSVYDKRKATSTDWTFGMLVLGLPSLIVIGLAYLIEG